ncbi:TetR family transcriptional regulator [Achromobacter xylosoxidans]
MKTSTTEPASPDRAADTRERLLLAGLTLFSQLGLEGVRTRQLSEAAGVNQSAIPYHFGGKEGVYAACWNKPRRTSPRAWTCPTRRPPRPV